MGSFRILVSAHSVRSRGLKELMPPRVHNLPSGDKEIKYLHILGIDLGVTMQIWSLLLRHCVILLEIIL